jgi:hypothetical protein
MFLLIRPHSYNITFPSLEHTNDKCSSTTDQAPRTIPDPINGRKQRKRDRTSNRRWESDPNHLYEGGEDKPSDHQDD